MQNVFVRQQAKNAFDTIKDYRIAAYFKFRDVLNANVDWKFSKSLTTLIKLCNSVWKKHVRENKSAAVLGFC